MLIESSFGNPKPKVQLLNGNAPLWKCSLTLTLLGQAVSCMFLGQHSLSKKSDCGWVGDFPLVPLFLSLSFSVEIDYGR